MSKLVVICQKVDENDDLLGFFVGWLKEFAKRYDRVEVITLGKGEYWLPINVSVHSLGKERGASKVGQLFTFYFLLFTLTPKASGVFCHMSPAFALIAWPFARLSRAKLVLWYLHRSVTLKLKIALRAVDTLVTADKESLNIRNEKIIETGHGIDVERFDVSKRDFDVSKRPLRILSVGRLSPIKDFGTLIRAAAVLKDQDRNIRVRIVGRAVMKDDHAYAQQLRHMVDGLGSEDIVEFAGFVPYRDMPAQYAWADVIVGGTPKGGLDKAILEGMAAGCVPLTSNEAMRESLEPYADGLVYAYGDPEALAEHIVRVPVTRERSRWAQQAVRERHALSAAIARIIRYL